MVIVEGIRQNWTPKPVRVEVDRCSYLEKPPFNSVPMRLANAFLIENIPYRWQRGVVDPLLEETARAENECDPDPALTRQPRDADRADAHRDDRGRSSEGAGREGDAPSFCRWREAGDAGQRRMISEGER